MCKGSWVIAGLNGVSPRKKEFLESRKGTELLGWEDSIFSILEWKIWSSFFCVPGSGYSSFTPDVGEKERENKERTLLFLEKKKNHEHRACWEMRSTSRGIVQTWASQEKLNYCTTRAVCSHENAAPLFFFLLGIKKMHVIHQQLSRRSLNISQWCSKNQGEVASIPPSSHMLPVPAVKQSELIKAGPVLVLSQIFHPSSSLSTFPSLPLPPPPNGSDHKITRKEKQSSTTQDVKQQSNLAGADGIH